MEKVKLIECPRDAWQGLPEVIPAETKAQYLRELILAGFTHIDAVSFVSPKHVRQMADSEEVMARLMELLANEVVASDPSQRTLRASEWPFAESAQAKQVARRNTAIRDQRSATGKQEVKSQDPGSQPLREKHSGTAEPGAPGEEPGSPTRPDRSLPSSGQAKDRPLQTQDPGSKTLRENRSGQAETGGPGAGIKASATEPEIIGIVVNEKGLERALATPGVSTIGYPYSISAYFRRANANMTRAESRQLAETLRRETKKAGKNLVVYISMAFGNPYEEPWGPEIVQDTLEWLKDIRVTTVSLADTVGTATPELVRELYSQVKDHVAGMELGVHLHSRAENAEEKVLAAYAAGCRRFDSALTGLGGCPFAGDELVGNIATESVVAALEKAGAEVEVKSDGLGHVIAMTEEIRGKYAHAAGQ